METVIANKPFNGPRGMVQKGQKVVMPKRAAEARVKTGDAKYAEKPRPGVGPSKAKPLAVPANKEAPKAGGAAVTVPTAKETPKRPA